MKPHFRITLLSVLLAGTLQASNLRQISSREGISNNAVLSLGQDKFGYLWVGTCDGLNMWDGERMQLFPAAWQKRDGLSGNLIEEIAVTRDSLFWIRTNYGLDLFDPESKRVERHPQFQGMYKIVTRRSDQILVLTQDNSFFGYDAGTRQFRPIEFPYEAAYDRTLAMLLDEQHLWICTPDALRCIPVAFNRSGRPEFGIGTVIEHGAAFEYAFAEGERLYLIDAKQTLYEADTANKRLVYIRELSRELAGRGNISKIIRDGDDYLISFYTDGAVRLRLAPANREKYIPEPINIPCGVFTLLKDARQEIVWIGTDGQGLYQQTHNDVAFRSITYNNLPYGLSKPVRALRIDASGALWIGTKGEGIVRIRDFRTAKQFGLGNTEHFTAANSALLDNSVYAFAGSGRNLLWIGTDGEGLNYYSFRDRAIRRLPAPHSGALKYIHALYESDPSTLWAATVGCGVYRIEIGGTDDRPEIRKIERLRFGDEFEIKNFFFSLCPQNDSTIWFGNRGGGAVRYDMRTGRSETFKFDRGRSAVANDIFAVHCSPDGSVWFGTSGGLLPQGCDSAVYATRNTVHAILEDDRRNLWLSTNRGIVSYSPRTGNVVTYGYSYGLNTIEYSDGAFFSDPETGALYFGGIDGFVVIEQRPERKTTYTPPVHFHAIRINDEIFHLGQLLSPEGILTLRHGQRLFSLKASAPDYIDGSNYTYYSRIEGFDEQWVAGTGLLVFNELPAGRYTLHVRYRNNMTGEESPVYGLPIRIRPPWYATTVARIVYALLLLGGTWLAFRYFVQRYRQRRAVRHRQLELRRKEEVYESKMRFFANITQELTVPLTMISGPCQQIIGRTGHDDPIRRHAETIRQNTVKLHDLIRMLREFRGINDIDRNDNIELVPVAELGGSIAETFTDYAAHNSIACAFDIEPHLVWSTDREGLSTILNTLLANAFKHTPFNGTVRLTIRSENGELLIAVANNSVGVDLDDIAAIFDRYRVLDYFERKSEKGLSFQGDLRLAICHSIALRMGGDITVESTPNALTTFTVRLPKLNLTEQPAAAEEPILPVEAPTNYQQPAREEPRREYEFDKHRQTMFIMNDNPEIMNFVADLFAPEYNIKMPDDAAAMTELLKQMHPDIVICGSLTRQAECLAMIRSVKQSKLTSHIPVILLSTAQQVDERIQGVESGADVCLTLPFNIEYLKAVAEQLLRRNRSLKDYYKSSISAFELSDGKMLHQDDKEFIDRMLKIINDNISNTDISTRFIADQMGVSIRNLYRRLEGILNQAPSHIIKEYRLAKAEQLLTTTKLSIDEIIYKAGFVNRGTFFKCFAARYGCTPKIYRKQKLSQLHEAVDGESEEDAACDDTPPQETEQPDRRPQPDETA